MSASAQLSGVYTIGGTSPSYATFNAAVTALLANGVNGPVTFAARAGTYTEAAITLTAISGASANNTITFESESGVNTDVNFNTAITLNAASYITIANLSMSVNGVIINLLGKSNNVTIAGNILTGPVATGAGSDVIQAISYTGANLVICSNVISNGSEGICLYGTDNTPADIITNAVIRNNLIQNFYYWGITANFQQGTLIEGNIITTAPTSNYGSIPLYIQNIEYPITVIKNKISITGPNYGIAGMYIVNNDPASLAQGPVIANNTISVNNGNGMYLINNSYCNFYYNTIYVITSGTCFIVDGNSTGNALADNILYDASGEPAISIGTGVSSSDYNDIYSTGANLGTWEGNNTASLAAWRTSSGFDAHSQSIAPAFVSDTNLNLTNYTPMQFGTPIASIPDAINGNTRSAPPAVGAYDNGAPYPADTATCCPCNVIIPTAPVAVFKVNRDTVCSGSPVVFTDQSTGSPTRRRWIFTGGTPDTSSAQSPVIVYTIPGNYAVTLVVSNANGSDSLVVDNYIHVMAGPWAGAITGPDSVCAGSTVLLADTGNSGTRQWKSSTDGLLYTSITGDTSATISINNLAQTTYFEVDASGYCPVPDSSAPFKVTVNPLPVPFILTPDSSICSGDSTMICTSNSYSSYRWNTGDTSFCATARLSGTYWVTVTDVNGCSAASGQQGIHQFPPTTIPLLSTTDSTICSSDSTRITSSGPYPSYAWNTGDTTNYTYVDAAGNYYLTVTDTNGCHAVSGRQAISVYPTPSVSIQVLGDTLSSFGQQSYLWRLDGTPLSADTTAIIVASQPGSYTVQITDTNGCTATSSPVLVTGINDLAAGENITIYPNPNAVGNWQLAVGNNLVGSALELFDDQGRLIFHSAISNQNSALSIEVPSGVYYLRISNENVSVVRKLVKL